MLKLSQKQEIEQLCHTNPAVLLYFTGSTCGACEIIKQKIEKIIDCYKEVLGIEVNGEKYPELAAAYEVFALPYFILFIEGRETVKEGKYVDLLEFERKLDRYVGFLN